MKARPSIPPAAYAAAKGGIESFTRYAASQGGPHNIRVNCVRHGQILTPMVSRVTPGRHFAADYANSVQITPGHGTAEETANVVLFLASDESRFVNGQVVNVDGGAAAKV